MPRPRRLLAPLALAVAVGLTGCAGQATPGVDPGGSPMVLVVSETWVASQGGAGAESAQARIAALQRAVTELREETSTGWTGRQDDVTGYLADLSGGGRDGDPADFMDTYGADLFGIDATSLELDVPDTDTVPGTVSQRATQVVAGVPVLDGTLVFTSRAGEVGAEDDRLTAVRGRVFPDLAVGTEPRIDPIRAARIAERAAGGTAEGPARLVVLPLEQGVLAWEVTVLADLTAQYYVDATTGDVVSVRPVSAESSAAGAAADPDPNTVEVTGADSLGTPLTGQGIQGAGGVTLTDTTTPSYDSTTGRGAISTYDATRVTSEGQLPGELVVSPDTQVRDADVMAAHAYSRDIIDYYAGLGRSSWDDRGGALLSSVHFGPSDFCNAFFASYLNPPQMVYGNPCTDPTQGTQSGSLVEIDIAAHEVTHGVTASTAGLIYAGQSGALNESFSDYFGNVIGNLVHGTDSVAVAEDSCDGFTVENRWCTQNPDGSFSLRYMLNGNDFDDYLRVLNPGYRLELLGITKQDYGGVHFNSRIWNNALWSIRTRLAQVDNTTGNQSELARAFDRAVYGALVTRLGPASGFLDARAAVEQVIVDSSLDPVVLRVAREVFDANKICVGCPTVGQLAGDTVSATPQTQLHPNVSGDLVAWLDLSSNADLYGYPATLRLGGTAPVLGTSPDALEVGFAGETVVALTARGLGQVIRIDATGKEEVLDRVDALATLTRGLSGSDAGAVWAPRVDTVSFVDPSGTVTTTTIPGLEGDTLIATGTGGGAVALGTDAGKVLRWQPGGAVTQVGTMSGAVITVAAYGGTTFAIDDAGQARLFTADGQTFDVSSKATPFGAALSADYAVWPESKGPISAGVVRGGVSRYPETDLYLLSLRTGKIYDLVPGQGQQGFPALSGRRLVWQDAAFGGDDILTAELPEGL